MDVESNLAYDTITGLPTLASTLHLVESHLNQKGEIGFLYFDVVQFHILKTIYGRGITDALLAALGAALREQSGRLFREDDLLAVGGSGADYFVVFLLSPPRKKTSFSLTDVKLISYRIVQHLNLLVNSQAADLGIKEKISFYSGYSVLRAEPGIPVERLVYEAQKEAALKAELDEIMVSFISNVTHELRTPLTCIKGYTETLLEGALEDRELATKWLGVVSQEANRLERLINDLLDISMIDSRQAKFALEVGELSEPIEHVVDVLTPIAQKAGIKLVAELEPDVPALVFDRDRISQVLINLVDNAIKYSPANTTVTIRLSRKESDWVQVEVIDKGIGIPEGQLSRVFERFYRVDRERTSRQSGRGLGLAIAKRIAQAHDGDITVSSKPGSGTTFTLQLPTGGYCQDGEETSSLPMQVSTEVSESQIITDSYTNLDEQVTDESI